MSVMIQLRNVPDELHRKLKARAASLGMSMSDYLLSELRPLADQPTMQEWLAMVSTRDPVNLTINPADVLREERDRR